MRYYLSILFFFTLYFVKAQDSLKISQDTVKLLQDSVKSLQDTVKSLQDTVKYNKAHVYALKDYYIDLDSLKVIHPFSKPSTTFKEKSKYAGRFTIPIWFEKFPKEAFFKSKKFNLVADSILITDSAGLVTIIKNPEPDIQLEPIADNNFLLCSSNGVVHVKKLEGIHGYVIRVYDETGKQVHYYKVPHTEYIENGASHYSIPYMSYFTCTDNDLIFTSYNPDYKKTYLLNLNNGKSASLDFIANGIIRDTSEKKVAGFVEINEEEKSIAFRMPDNYCTADYEKLYYNHAETILKNTTLVIATFSDIASGSDLTAYNINSGKVLWKADVKQLNASHSKYWNSVTLSLMGNKIIMEGNEAFGRYVQVFDFSTGKRLFTSD